MAELTTIYTVKTTAAFRLVVFFAQRSYLHRLLKYLGPLNIVVYSIDGKRTGATKLSDILCPSDVGGQG